MNNIANAVARRENKKMILGKENIPYINKYLFFIQGELNIKFEDELWDKLNMIRKVRNKMIHTLGNDIRPFMNEKLKSLLSFDSVNTNGKLDYDFTVRTFSTVCEIIKLVEKGFIKKYPESRVFK
ncbi:hypothetical protein KFZ56_02060 [Virgibacillus sp. NKC19-3]|uniref:hypothetical protein n=1 Tax=Virgibacillus saliphilus TaxID=2831674 RepID=UPI001C9A6AE6|nr:hypothetical protein [Virgibacillus sp. NKC19-3]MBY7141889.1 hypothetical protein [Virgibacillus sp. NKC19-3]